MSSLEISLDREANLAVDGKPLYRCQVCGVFTYRDACPFCGGEDLKAAPTGDSMVDEIITKRDAGESAKLSDYIKRLPDGSYQINEPD